MLWASSPMPSKRGARLSRERAPSLASPPRARMQQMKAGLPRFGEMGWPRGAVWGGRAVAVEAPGSPPQLPPHRLPWKHIPNKSWAWINKCVRRPPVQPAPRGGGEQPCARRDGDRLKHQSPGCGQGMNLTSLIFFPPSPPQSNPQQVPGAPSPLPTPAAGIPRSGHSPKGEGSSPTEMGAPRHRVPTPAVGKPGLDLPLLGGGEGEE